MAESGPIRLGVSYFGNRYPAHAERDLATMAAMGADDVVHVMSEADLRWNPGTIRQLVDLGRAHGLSSWLAPWGVGGVFGGEAASYAVGEHPDACQHDNRGAPLPALCPRQPAFWALLDAWLDAVVAAGADTVLWDEPHLAASGAPDGRWACRCEACQAAFRDRIGTAMPVELSADVQSLVRDLLDATLARLVEAARRRGLASAVVFLADDTYDPDRWRAAASLPGVRWFGATPYWLFHGVPPAAMPDYVRDWAKRIVAATDGLPAAPLAWLQAFQVPAGREAEIEHAAAIYAAAGVRALAVWAYLACVAMSGLAPDDPVAVWAAVERAFAALRSPASNGA
ncbi:MAG TPA: hypothetical protein VFI22_01705 [Thermomicrobiales bacterium]|nr:hypothetical protein [Thermomicrobiales bacterium]